MRRFTRETRDVGVGPLLAVAGLLAFLAACAPLLQRLQVRLMGRLERADADRPAALSVLPPPPRLQARPAFDLWRMRREEEEKLEGWGWYDRRAGLARVPIERAMDALADASRARGRRP